MKMIRIVLAMGYYPSEIPDGSVLIGGPDRKPLGMNYGDWNKVMWGAGTLRGRLPTALCLADQLDADYLGFVIGDAQFEAGPTESEWFRDYARGAWSGLKRDFGPFFTGDRFSTESAYLEWLDRIAFFEDHGFNTANSLRHTAGRIARMVKGDRGGLVNVVSSANHAQRVLRDVHIALEPLIKAGVVMVSATTAATCYSDTCVADVQVKDRGDASVRAWVKA